MPVLDLNIQPGPSVGPTGYPANGIYRSFKPKKSPVKTRRLIQKPAQQSKELYAAIARQNDNQLLHKFEGQYIYIYMAISYTTAAGLANAALVPLTPPPSPLYRKLPSASAGTHYQKGKGHGSKRKTLGNEGCWP
jgi:hypothetical protein